MKTIFKIIIAGSAFIFIVISCDSGKKRMLVPPGEAPEELLRDIGIADATADAEITIDTTLEPVEVGNASDITIEPSKYSGRAEIPSKLIFFHKCREGDSLLDLANKYDVNLAELGEINNRAENRPLSKDQVLLLPRNINDILNAEDVKSYTVVGGDTYSKIARKFHIAHKALMTINEANDSSLIIGDVLYVPDVSKK